MSIVRKSLMDFVYKSQDAETRETEDMYNEDEGIQGRHPMEYALDGRLTPRELLELSWINGYGRTYYLYMRHWAQIAKALMLHEGINLSTGVDSIADCIHIQDEYEMRADIEEEWKPYKSDGPIPMDSKYFSFWVSDSKGIQLKDKDGKDISLIYSTRDRCVLEFTEAIKYRRPYISFRRTKAYGGMYIMENEDSSYMTMHVPSHVPDVLDKGYYQDLNAEEYVYWSRLKYNKLRFIKKQFRVTHRMAQYNRLVATHKVGKAYKIGFGIYGDRMRHQGKKYVALNFRPDMYREKGEYAETKVIPYCWLCCNQVYTRIEEVSPGHVPVHIRCELKNKAKITRQRESELSAKANWEIVFSIRLSRELWLQEQAMATR